MSVPTRPAAPTPPPAQPATYCNPVYDGYLADPYVLAWQDGYLAYGTGPTDDGRIFPILRSADLVHWTPVGGAMEPVDGNLGMDYWAPEVVEADSRFWLYYSVGHGDHRHQLRVAVADSPLGPFTDTGIDLTPHESFAIDPHPYCDDDGTWYLFYARDVLDADRVGTHLAVAELTDMTSLSAPATAVLAPTADWQIFQRDREMYGGVYDWHTLEGPPSAGTATATTAPTPAAPTSTRATTSPGSPPPTPSAPGPNRPVRRTSSWPPSPVTSAALATTASSPPTEARTCSSTTPGTPTAPNVRCVWTLSPGTGTGPPPPAPAGPSRHSLLTLSPPDSPRLLHQPERTPHDTS